MSWGFRPALQLTGGYVLGVSSCLATDRGLCPGGYVRQSMQMLTTEVDLGLVNALRGKGRCGVVAAYKLCDPCVSASEASFFQRL